ncbi:TPA: aromatic ring-hydroxylating dioxygenase subunit alpha, partial [Pseudomonas aeruginosa]
MSSTTNPALSDGTRISDLIDLEKHEVKMRTLSDPELYALEMKKIFARTWVFLGHETEIPNKGDFIVRDMGSDSVIVARSSDEQIYVSLNV